MIIMKKIFCWKCGKNIPEKANYCIYCGANITENDSKRKQPESKNKNSKNIKKQKTNLSPFISWGIAGLILISIFIPTGLKYNYSNVTLDSVYTRFQETYDTFKRAGCDVLDVFSSSYGSNTNNYGIHCDSLSRYYGDPIRSFMWRVIAALFFGILGFVSFIKNTEDNASL